jgi:hypothetical protein
MAPYIRQNEILRKTAGYSLLDHKRNELKTEELTVTPTIKYLTYGRNGLQQINQMEHSRLPNTNASLWSTGRPPKRWMETLTGL